MAGAVAGFGASLLKGVCVEEPVCVCCRGEGRGPGVPGMTYADITCVFAALRSRPSSLRGDAKGNQSPEPVMVSPRPAALSQNNPNFCCPHPV